MADQAHPLVGHLVAEVVLEVLVVAVVLGGGVRTAVTRFIPTRPSDRWSRVLNRRVARNGG